MDKIYFLSFYTNGPPVDNGSPLGKVADEIKKTMSNYFTDVFMYDKSLLKSLDNSETVCNEFSESLDRNINANFVGYFDFKPFLISHTLKNIPENSILVYHDSNFERNPQYWETDWPNIFEISNRLLKEVDSDIFVQFERDIFVKEYVKTYTIDNIITNPVENQIVKNSFLINAARIIMKNTQFTRNFMKKYHELCQDKSLISKYPNPLPDQSFKWSCGDQDVLNCLVYKYILERKFKPEYPVYEFLYRVLRFDNRPFIWPNQSWNPHPTNAIIRNNFELIKYINKDKTMLAGVNLEVPTDLCNLMGKHGSDKGSNDISNSWHNYTVLYNKLFENFKDKKINLFELGILRGASLRGWSDYFINGNIFGGDIDTKTFLNENRIRSFYCDQGNKESISMLWKNLPEEFEVIIDDGNHELYANICFFENSIHKLKSGGYFIVEDIRNMHYDSFKNIIINKWIQKYKDLSFELIKLPSNKNLIDNNLLIVKKI
jgi:hypothetical protein